MFREMRRFKNAIPKEDAIKMLERCTNGVLSVCGEDGYPYGVPVSYTYLKNKIYLVLLIYENLISRCDGIGRRARLKIL